MYIWDNWNNDIFLPPCVPSVTPSITFESTNTGTISPFVQCITLIYKSNIVINGILCLDVLRLL